MRLGITKEILPLERRVATTPEVVKKLIKKAQTPVTAFLFFLLFECLCLME